MPTCPCHGHPMREPAPFGAPAPCCRGAKLLQWRPVLQQYAFCRLQDVLGRVIGGCGQVWWHDGTRWVAVDPEAAWRLERLL